MNLNTPAHTALLADTDLHLKTAATEIDTDLGAGYQYGYYTGPATVYDTSGTFGVTVPGLNQIQGAIGTMMYQASGGPAPYFGTAPCLFQLASYNAGGPGTVYGQVWYWPYTATVTLPPVPPSTIGQLVHQLQPMWPIAKNTVVYVNILAWGTVL